MKGVAKKYMRGFFVTSNVSVKNIKKNTEVVHVHRIVTRGPQIVGRPAPRLKKNRQVNRSIVTRHLALSDS
jgi:hypothetical protein